MKNTPPNAQEISQGPRGAKFPPLGNLEGRGGCIFQYIPTRGSTRTCSHHYQGSIDFDTVNIHPTVGMYFLIETVILSNGVTLTEVKTLTRGFPALEVDLLVTNEYSAN